MFQVSLSNNLSLKVLHNHLRKKMKIMMMTKSLNFPTILRTIKFETFSITSTPERARLLLLIISLSMQSNNSQFYTKAHLGLSTLFSINLRLPSVANQYQFSQLLDILQAMV